MFCTVNDMELLLQVVVSEPEQIASAERAIGAATAAIREYCRQWLYPVVTDAVQTFDVLIPRYNLLLAQLPVVEVSSVVEDGELLTVDDDYTLTQDGQLLREGGRWALGAGSVVVTYSYGYATLPEIICDVATRSASRIFQAGLRAAAMGGVAGINAMTLGDYSVTYGGESSGGVSEGVLGVSAARALLLSEKDLLNRYRV
jgi:hypothetical protein